MWISHVRPPIFQTSAPKPNELRSSDITVGTVRRYAHTAGPEPDRHAREASGNVAYLGPRTRVVVAAGHSHQPSARNAADDGPRSYRQPRLCDEPVGDRAHKRHLQERADDRHVAQER